MRNWTNEEIQRYLGTHRECYLTHAKDDSVRDGAASGGTTSSLLIDLLEQKRVDGVLVWRMVCDQPDPVTEPFIAKPAKKCFRPVEASTRRLNFRARRFR